MSIAELERSQAAGDDPEKGLLSFDFPRPYVGAEAFADFALSPTVQLDDSGDTFVRVFHGTHPDNTLANGLEITQMVALGDSEEFSREEFVPVFGRSFIIATGVGDDVRGVMRITPYDANEGLKTFSDLQTLVSKSRDELEQEFMAQTGCEDMTKVWDVTTLALAFVERNGRKAQAPMLDRIKIIKNMLVALTDIGCERLSEKELTHLVSANHPNMHAALQAWGYPLKDIDGYGELNYDVGNIGQSMICRPAYFSAQELKDIIAGGGDISPFAREFLDLSRFALRVF